MSELIESLIPHRAPMLWISGIVGFEEKKFTATANFRAEDYCVADGKVIETALVECVAQTVAAALGQRQQIGGEGQRTATNAMLVGVTGFKILARPPIGKTIQIEFREARRLGPMLMIDCSVAGDGEIYATGKLSLYA